MADMWEVTGLRTPKIYYRGTGFMILIWAKFMNKGVIEDTSSNTIQSLNITVDFILGQRRRRWTNIEIMYPFFVGYQINHSVNLPRLYHDCVVCSAQKCVQITCRERMFLKQINMINSPFLNRINWLVIVDVAYVSEREK